MVYVVQKESYHNLWEFPQCTLISIKWIQLNFATELSQELTLYFALKEFPSVSMRTFSNHFFCSSLVQQCCESIFLQKNALSLPEFVKAANSFVPSEWIFKTNIFRSSLTINIVNSASDFGLCYATAPYKFSSSEVPKLWSTDRRGSVEGGYGRGPWEPPKIFSNTSLLEW